MRRSMLALLTVASLVAAPGGEATTLRTDTSKALVPLDEIVVILYQPGTLSALDDEEIKRSRAVGATGTFSRVVEGRALTFEPTAGSFRDRETGSTWTLLGHAVKGTLAGRRLTAIPHVDAFWFAWAAFNPATSVYAER
jgi:hypothetical protein